MRDTDSKGTEITMPQLAESVVSATISKWLKQPGDYVEEYEPICEIVTDKVTAELPCSVEGTLLKIIVEEGATVDVGTTICTIDAKDQENEKADQIKPANADRGEKVPASSKHQGEQSMRRRYSPAVRALADDHEIELEELTGTGLGGRITRKDVLLYIESGKPGIGSPHQLRSSGLHLNTPTPVKSSSKVEEYQSTGGRNEYYIDVNPIRNTIATRMRQSVSEIPHAWTMIEVDITNLVVLRNKQKQEFMRQEGVNLTYLSFVIKAVVNAIKDYPIMNSVWAVDKIIVKKDINISLAVGTEDSVFVPVIKKADQKNIAGLAREVDELTRKARAGKLTADDMQGGTFTVNNTGSFGSILSYPIINYPQAANFTFEAIVKKPVVIDDMIAVRSMVNLCLSLDHRILDGVICGRFMQRVKENIEGYGPDTKLY
jgi:2-oxoisovalerate dehydrogenase E2 component (dihydrolipoyl transacylase)